MRTYRGLILVGALAVAVPACSGGDKDQAEEPAEEASAQEEAAAPEGGATDEAAPAAEPEAEATPPAAQTPAATPAPAPAAPAEPEGFGGAKVTRFVTTVAIKIHAQPAKDAPVVGWVKKGDKLDVVVNGEWAKLDTGKYVSAKFLSEQDPATAAPAGKKAKKAGGKKAKKSK